MPKLAAGLIYSSMLTVYESEKSKLADHWEYSQKLAELSGVDLTQEIERDNSNLEPPYTNEAVAKLKDEPQVGVLGNFILLLLRNLYKVEPFSRNYVHFFGIMSRFASLGPEARAFLLRARSVGRFLDFFYARASTYREHFSRMWDLGPIVPTLEPEMGLPTKLDPKMMGYLAQLRERKRLGLLGAAQPKHKFLLEAVSRIIRHVQIKDSPYQFDNDSSKVTQFVDPAEQEILFPDVSYITRVFAQARKTRSMNAISDAYLHLGANDTRHVDDLFRVVCLGLKDYDHDRLRPFFHLLEKLLTSPLPHCQENQTKWLTAFMRIVTANSGFWRWMDAAFEFIFRMMHRNLQIREWFYANDQAKQNLAEWIQENNKTPGQGCRLYKDRQQNAAALQCQESTQTSQGIIGSDSRLKQMQMWFQGTFPEITPESIQYDLEQADFQDYKFLPEDLVVLYDRQTEEATRWRVTTVLDEMISMLCLETTQLHKGQSKWHKCDSDKLIPSAFFSQVPRIIHRREAKETWIARVQAMRQQQMRQAAEKKARAAKAAAEAEAKAGKQAVGSQNGSDENASDEYDGSDGDNQEEDLYS